MKYGEVARLAFLNCGLHHIWRDLASSTSRPETDTSDRILSGRAPSRSNSARASANHNQSSRQQQPAQSPFGNVDPNIVNGTNYTQNGSASVNNTFDSNSQSSFQFTPSANSNIFSSQPSVPSSSGFDFAINSNSAISNPFSNLTNGTSSTAPSTNSTGYQGSLFNFSSPTPTKPQQGTLFSQQESRGTHNDPNSNNNVRPLWAPHAPFNQGKENETQASTNSTSFTDMTSQQSVPTSNFFGLPASQTGSSANVFGSFNSQPSQPQSSSIFTQPESQAKLAPSSSNVFSFGAPNATKASQPQSNIFGNLGTPNFQASQSVAQESPDAEMSTSPPAKSYEGGNSNGLFGNMLQSAAKTSSSSSLFKPSSGFQSFGDGSKNPPITSLNGPVQQVTDKTSKLGVPSPLFGASLGITKDNSSENINQSSLFSAKEVSNPTSLNPLFTTSTSQQKPLFVTSIPSNSSEQESRSRNTIFNGAFKPSSVSMLSHDSSSGIDLTRDSSTIDQMEKIMPPSIPDSFSDAQKRDYIIKYRLKSLNVALKKHVEGNMLHSMNPALQFYSLTTDKILGTKRKATDDGDPEGITQRKRTKTNGSTLGGNPAKPSLFDTTASSNKRKADEDIRKDVLGNGLIENGKKARNNDQMYPALSSSSSPKPAPKVSQTAAIFAEIANGTSTTISEDETKNPQHAQTPSGFPSTSSAQFVKGSGAHLSSSTPSALKPTFNSASSTAPSSSSHFASKADSTNSILGNQSMSGLFNSKSTVNEAGTSNQKGSLNMGVDGSATASPPLFSPFKPSNGTFPSTVKHSEPSTISKELSGGNASRTDQPVFSVPKFGGVPGNNFLTQFGQAAKRSEKEMAKEAKAKRKAEEYDSEEDDEAEWERKDEEAQRAKKQKIEEAGKNEGFKFAINNPPQAESHAKAPFAGFTTPGVIDYSSNQKSSDNPFAHLSNPGSDAGIGKAGDADDEESDEESDEDEHDGPPFQNHAETSNTTSSSTTRSIFDRMETNVDGTPKRETLSHNENVQKTASLSNSLASNEAEHYPNRQSMVNGLSNPFSQPSSRSTNTSPFGSHAPSGGNNWLGTNSTTPTTNPFANVSTNSGTNEGVSSSSPQLDNTWRADSPIKFSGKSNAPSVSITSPSPSKAPSMEQKSTPFSTLFGASKSDGNLSSKPTTSLFGASSGSTANTSAGFSFGASPLASTTTTTTGFLFGGPSKPFANLSAASVLSSANTSRATSPGVSTGAESGAEGGEDDATPDVQIDIATARAGEEDEDILFEVKAKGSEFDWNRKGSKDEKDWTKEWMMRGVGSLRVLKHRDTGKTRVVLRAGPAGKVVLNAALIESMDYKHATDKSVMFGAATGAGKMAQWNIMVGKKDDATRLASLLQENKSN